MNYHNYHSGAIFMVYNLFVCNIIMKYQRPSQHETLNQCQLNVGTSSVSCPNIESTLVKRILSAPYPDKDKWEVTDRQRGNWGSGDTPHRTFKKMRHFRDIQEGLQTSKSPPPPLPPPPPLDTALPV